MFHCIQNAEEFLKVCSSYAIPSLLPDKQILVQPGGQLIHSMAGHKEDIRSLDITADNKMAMSCTLHPVLTQPIKYNTNCSFFKAKWFKFNLNYSVATQLF